MSIFSGITSGIGNILHGVANFFDGGDDQKKRDQQQQAQQQQASAPVQNAGPAIQAINDAAAPEFNLVQGPQKVKPAPIVGAPANPAPAQAPAVPTADTQLIKATPPAPVVSNPNPPTPAQKPGFLGNFVDNLKKAVSPLIPAPLRQENNLIKNTPQGQGIAAGAGRAGSDIIKGFVDLPSEALNLSKWAADKTVGPNLFDTAAPALQKVTDKVNEPFTGVNKSFDTYADADPRRRQTYVPAQVGTNIAALIPGAAEVGATLLTKAGADAPELIAGLQKVASLGKLSSIFGDAGEAGQAGNEISTAAGAAPDLTAAGEGPAAESVVNAPHAAPDEVSPGIKTANPNQAAEAAAQAAEHTPPVGAVTPTDITAREVTPPAVEPAPTAPGVVENPVNLPETPQTPEIPAKTPQVPQTPVVPEIPQIPAPAEPVVPNTPPVASAPPNPADVARAVAEGKPVGAGLDVNGNPNLVSSEASARAAEAAGINPNPVAPLIPDELPAAARTAPNAPNVREQLVKQLGDAGKAAGDVTQHDVLSNQELDTAANRLVQSTPPNELLIQYSGVPDITSAADLAHAKASLPVLADMTKDPDTAAMAQKAIDNILEGTEKHLSASGRSLNYSQSMYDALPREAKVSLTIRTLDKARQAAGMPLIADNLPMRAAVEDHLNELLAAGEDLQNKLAGVQGEVQKIQDAVGTGNLPGNVGAQLNALEKQNAALELQAKVQNNETARFYNSLVPGKAGLEKTADWARTSMLTAPSGRLNNVFNVGGNSLYEIARSLPQSLLNKGVNLVRGAGETEDQSLLNQGLKSGFKQGLSKVKASLQGNDLGSNLSSSLRKGNPDRGVYELSPTADNKGFNRIANVTHALVKAPSEVIGGAIKNAQLNRMANAEGKAAGFVGDDLKVYTKARSIVPSRQMIDKAQELQDQVSHMNKNPLADFVGKALGNGQSAASGNMKGAAGLLRNTFLPFPKYASTFVWNTLSDRNVIADTVKAVSAIKNGDIEGLTKALSGGALDTAGMYVGYHLTNMGLITNKDANGYSDDGMYLHLGNRYIPLGSMGVLAEPLLAGGAIHDAVSSGGNPAEKFASVIANTAFDTIKAAGAQNLVGAGDQGIQALQNAFTGSNGVHPLDAAAVVGGQFAGQFIPGIASDVNAVLNHTGLNPTGEASLTKVEKGGYTPSGDVSTAKNIPASELNTLKNRIPFLSQSLPRNPGTTANDFVDRVTRGSHVGDSQGAVLQKAQNLADRVKSNTDAGVPDPQATYKKGDSFNDAVENRIENKNYDQAIQGLQAKLSDVKAEPNLTTKKTDPIEKQIKEVQVLKNGNFDPSVRDLYSKTSVAEWRNMGDSTSDTYDPATYQLLYNYDSQLAKVGASSASSKATDNKYTAKGAGKGRGSGSASKVASVGSPVNLGTVSFGALAPQKVTAAGTQLPVIRPNAQAGPLIKKRAISVTR